jgi:hypothetical protein
MALYSDLATRWLGRCLIQVKLFKKDKPELSLMNISDLDNLTKTKVKGQYLEQQLNKAKKLTTRYEMRSEIYYGMMLPEW